MTRRLALLALVGALLAPATAAACPPRDVAHVTATDRVKTWATSPVGVHAQVETQVLVGRVPIVFQEHGRVIEFMGRGVHVRGRSTAARGPVTFRYVSFAGDRRITLRIWVKGDPCPGGGKPGIRI